MSTAGSPPTRPSHSPIPGYLETQDAPMETHRRQVSTGGGRAWSEEEETYLIETRMHKMPYKHIAAHLQKTELACRLHYHQLSFGTKRRRRTSSVSSMKSASSLTVHDPTGVQQKPLPTLSPPDSPEHSLKGAATAPSPSNPVPILPKPVIGSQRLMQQHNALHLITQDIERFEERSRVNKDRLSRIYEAHRTHFWSMIARDYGENVSPAVLEDVWRRGYASSTYDYPPTPPNRSPQSTTASPSAVEEAYNRNRDAATTTSFIPVNIPRSAHSAPSVPTIKSFAISSLLTEDKEVRSPGKRMKMCEV